MPHAAFDRRAIPAGARVSHWHAPDGWALRTIQWPAAGAVRGSILFLSGRGDHFEKYLETLGHWQDRGWSVASFDWRGQGGSGRVLPDRHIGHADGFETYVDDLREFFAQWREATPGAHVIIGHSMGGHLLLRALIEGAVMPDAAVLVAPMLGLKGPPAWFAQAFAGLMTRIGAPDRAAWKANERPGLASSRQALLTHDAERYADEGWWREADADLALGPPSWGWLLSAYRSARAMRGDPRLRAMAVPLLVLSATADRLVDPAATRAVAALLPDATLVEYGAESAHEILREADPVRDRALAAIDAFVDARAVRA